LISDFVGKLKAWQQRLSSYVSMISFIMVFYLYIIKSPMGLEWYHWLVIIGVGISFLLFVDIRYIFPSMQKYQGLKHPILMEMYDDIKKIKQQLDSLEGFYEN